MDSKLFIRVYKENKKNLVQAYLQHGGKFFLCILESNVIVLRFNVLENHLYLLVCLKVFNLCVLSDISQNEITFFLFPYE